jgi:hypothetical protein
MSSFQICRRNGTQLLVHFDEIDRSLIEAHRWHALMLTGRCYVQSRIAGKEEYLHRLIMCAPKNLCVDHINGDGLDNRRANLRICTGKENQHNMRRHRDSQSPYKGVRFDPRDGCWYARIYTDGHEISLGAHRSPEAAALAYDDAAVRCFGVFAKLNFGELR